MATLANRSTLPDRVLLYHNSIPVAICSAKHFTPESLELYCGPLRYERNTDLEVEVQFDLAEPESRFRLPTRVVRCDKNHLVLSYSSLPEEAAAYLQGWAERGSGASPGVSPARYAH
ncbi:hypothetical protein AN478_09780 [Thiohalorhabdus denitrificans]|uniref:PilZ domain-containing protein n=1 Tax=Thiohalorhabdus denitrificans TaxID=381306 RepID=A0A0P9C3X5_9GAMM|nr:hypothetical protein [Thiohalorhabdus denitrificans]KPV39452.1 hypothetical protein AN478_09780 [Thiohalorhabdus denitrificans]SCY02504.1 hypothetical protein SAMN05661077_1082 [Thiohalorhabdus denitrificans]